MNNTAILLLIGAGAFLWYKNKTKLGPRASYPLHIGPGHPRAIMSSMIKNKKQKRDNKFFRYYQSTEMFYN